MKKVLFVFGLVALAACAGKEKAQGASMAADTGSQMSADTTGHMMGADTGKAMSADSMARDTSKKM